MQPHKLADPADVSQHRAIMQIGKVDPELLTSSVDEVDNGGRASLGKRVEHKGTS